MPGIFAANDQRGLPSVCVAFVAAATNALVLRPQGTCARLARDFIMRFVLTTVK